MRAMLVFLIARVPGQLLTGALLVLLNAAWFFWFVRGILR